jgi:hypothetical protein
MSGLDPRRSPSAQGRGRLPTPRSHRTLADVCCDEAPDLVDKFGPSQRGRLTQVRRAFNDHDGKVRHQSLQSDDVVFELSGHPYDGLMDRLVSIPLPVAVGAGAVFCLLRAWKDLTSQRDSAARVYQPIFRAIR